MKIVTTVSDDVDTTATDAAAYPAVMAARDMATKGEGAYLSVFGVKDIDAAVARAEQAGVRTVARYEVDQRLPADSTIQCVQGSDAGGDVRDEFLPPADRGEVSPGPVAPAQLNGRAVFPWRRERQPRAQLTARIVAPADCDEVDDRDVPAER